MRNELTWVRSTVDKNPTNTQHLSCSLLRSLLHATHHNAPPSSHILLLALVDHLVELALGFVLHAANVLHGEPVPRVHLADQLSHGAGEHLDLLRTDHVLHDGLQTEVLEGAG